jgi:hypothetical protein
MKIEAGFEYYRIVSEGGLTAADPLVGEWYDYGDVATLAANGSLYAALLVAPPKGELAATPQDGFEVKVYRLTGVPTVLEEVDEDELDSEEEGDDTEEDGDGEDLAGDDGEDDEIENG